MGRLVREGGEELAGSNKSELQDQVTTILGLRSVHIEPGWKILQQKTLLVWNALMLLKAASKTGRKGFGLGKGRNKGDC